MRYIAAALGFLLVLATEAKVGDSSPSCTETKECLSYTLVCQADEYEVRHYGRAKWAHTTTTSRVMELALIPSFRRLYSYITGQNANGTTIDMTSPVTIKSPTKKSFFKLSKYTMSFLLPSQHQRNPPKPLDPLVFITEEPDKEVYVRSYGQWMTTVTDRWNSWQLRKTLDSAGATYEGKYQTSVGYDSPMKMLNRHNEVWFNVEGKPVCPAKPA